MRNVKFWLSYLRLECRLLKEANIEDDCVFQWLPGSLCPAEEKELVGAALKLGLRVKRKAIFNP